MNTRHITNPGQGNIRTYVRLNKVVAQIRYDANFFHPGVRNDSALAINAWDELLGQLGKHRPVDPAYFETTKDTALRIIAMAQDKEYRAEQEEKIRNIKL